MVITGLRQRNRLEGADYVVWAFFSEEAFVISRAEVPGRALVIFVAIKPPDPAHYDETTDPVVPEITDIMKTKVCTCVGPGESDVIVKHDLRQPDHFRLQIVGRTDEAHGLTFRAHQNRMCRGLGTLPFHTAQECAIANSCRAKNNALPVGQVVGPENAIQIFFVAVVD